MGERELEMGEQAQGSELGTGSRWGAEMVTFSF